MKGCLIALAVVLLIAIVAFAAIGHGESPLSLAASPQRDIIVHVPDAFDIFNSCAWIMADSSVLDAERRRSLERLRGYNNWFVRLFLPSFETALAFDLPTEPGREPSGVAAVHYGRIGRLIMRLTMGNRNPCQKAPDKPRFWRFGTTGAFQIGETYDIAPRDQTNPFDGFGDYLAAAVVYPERIEGRLRISLSPTFDSLHIPWPITELKLTLNNAEASGKRCLALHGDASFRAEKTGPLVRNALSAGALPSLADRFITPDTVFATGWVCPDAADVYTMMTEFMPKDAYLQTRYRLGIQSFRNDLAASAGPRAALLIYTQRAVRMAPGYSGILFVQELAQPDRVRLSLPSLLHSVSLGIVEEGGAAPDGYPYFVHKQPSAGLPEFYLYHSDLLRPSEGYQPVILVHDGMLVYASSKETLGLALKASGESGMKSLISARFICPGDLGWTQLERVYAYFVAEYLAARTAQATLTDDTDYGDVFKKVKSVLQQFERIDFSLSSENAGVFAADAKLYPKSPAVKE